MTVYADELFMINFISCFAMLYLYSAFAELERVRIRLVMASATGALIALMRFCTEGMISVIAQAMEVLIPKIAYRKISLPQILLFMLIKYLLSGIAVLAVSVFGGSSAIIRGGIIYFDIPHLLFLAIFLMVYPIFCITAMLIKRKERRIYNLRIQTENSETVLKALYDSGNMLRNPYDKSAVIITEKDSIDFDESSGFMLIPFRALNHSAMLKAFKAESVFCIEKNIEIKNITIGISEEALSETGQYNALIGPGIF